MSQVFEILNPSEKSLNEENGRGEIVLLVDHASNAIPDEFDGLGLSGEELRAHIAWDIGAAELARELAARLQAVAVLARFSRLVIDPNRELDDPSLIVDFSDHIPVSGNQNMSEAERQHRIDAYYAPYHDACTRTVDAARSRGGRPLVIGLHSFTPTMATGEPRPWQVAVMWDADPGLAHAIARPLEAEGLTVGFNEPYSGHGLFHSVRYHGGEARLPHAQIEVRQDLLADPAAISEWGDRFEAILGQLGNEY